ncbi:MAG TPA: mandelate racemase/muconate lactonizing enzyme family protein [Bryobacteraceae bacterium]|nr:mandelate racemase/muconate lactonizing enzyme family protein [Bryobacteraceae bacterium]
MQITNVTTAVMESNFDWTIVKVETDEKIVGYGEAFLGPGLPAVIREFRALLIGEDPSSIDRVLRRLRASCVHASPGLTYHAISGIESALLDAIGKRYHMPIWQILGGKYREQVPVYADCHAGDALESINPLLLPRKPQWLRKENEAIQKTKISVKHHGWDASRQEHLTPKSYGIRAREMAERGFRILKFDIDVPTPFETDEYNRDLTRAEIEYAESLVAAVVNAVDPEIGVAIDCHWNYGVEAAIGLARALEPHHLLWFEDPVPPENIRAIGEVQRNTRTTISTGENHYHKLDFERLIVEAGLRVLAPDVQKMGLWEGRKIAELADMHYVNLTLHNISGPIGTLAGVHLSAAMPNLLALEWHAASVPFFDDLVKGGREPMIRNGKVLVPDAPGLGIELDEEVAYKYQKPGEKFFE